MNPHHHHHQQQMNHRSEPSEAVALADDTFLLPLKSRSDALSVLCNFAPGVLNEPCDPAALFIRLLLSPRWMTPSLTHTSTGEIDSKEAVPGNMKRTKKKRVRQVSDI